MKGFAVFFVLITTSCFGYASGLENCLQLASKKEHRLDRIDATQACLQKVSVFTVAQNHDEAKLECYSQFQDTIIKTQYLKIGEQLIYPAKKNILFLIA